MENALQVNRKRLEKNLYELSKIGKSEQGGINRALGSRAEREARRWLAAYWAAHLHQQVQTDPIANMWVVRPGTACRARIACGSHHDTVTEGGMYDGAMGVLLATEVLETLEERRVATRHPFAAVSFTGEEPNPFNVSTLGSKVLSGRLHRADLEPLKNAATQEPLATAIAEIGGDITRADQALLNPGDVCAFVECHIEQGRRLFDRHLSLATVREITGIYRENILVLGEANHAGTTVMRDRHDALLAAGELNLAFEEAVRALGSDEVVGTIGQFTVHPNSVNIIPGRVELVLEIRTCEPAVKREMIAAVDRAAERISARRAVQFQRTVNLDQPAVPMSPVVQDALRRAILPLQPACELLSMAGHDAANIARRTQAGMLFVQSLGGKSHCAGEDTRMDDIEKAGNVLLHALLALDKELKE